MKTYDNLSVVYNGVSSFKSDITKEKNKLFQTIATVKWWKSVLPDQIHNEKTRKKKFEDRVHNFPGLRRNIQSINREIESKEKLLKYSNELESFVSKRFDYVQSIISLIDRFKLCIDNANSKLQMSKSKLNKQKLIQYIINLIDTIDFIISVEPSQIVEHLKPIYSIKLELESIINSLRIMDIQSDILKLESIQSQIVDINSFSTSMKKLNEYISSLESHLRGIERITNSLRNIENLINSNYIKLILSEGGLEEFYRINYKSKLDEKDPVRKYIDQIKDYIFILNYLVSKINENINKIEALIIKLKKELDSIKIQIKCLKSDIREMECAIEGVARNFIRCSLQSLRIHVITGRNCVNHNRDNNDKRVNN